ncbi:MAG: 4-(cytidine 5'-diphospho)-2-C-methyl-D-erythritol kinase [Firmicutes bacterium]|nr:4-(cytidine 5'-diphospho)-2-C-methyl-D-erythritol kinase [Bacillota bacterium]
MAGIRLIARAKINLTLDVTGVRPDGYHTLETIFHSIALGDVLSISKTPIRGIRLRTDKPWVPSDSRNLVWRAAEYMMHKYAIHGGLNIELEKKIPVGAGLGGGSADCAAAIFGINALFALKIPKKELLELCARFGADVPFCFLLGCALGEGIGELLTPLDTLSGFYIVIAKPPVAVSTAYIYKKLDMSTLSQRPNTPAMLRAIASQDYSGICGSLCNVLEVPTFGLFPQVGRLKEEIRALGADGVLMSGSGAGVYGLFASEASAKEAAERLRREGLGTGLKEVFVTEPYKKIKKDKLKKKKA